MLGWEIDLDHLHRIVTAPPVKPLPPLSREKNVRLLMACHRVNGYLLVDGTKVRNTNELDLLVSSDGTQRRVSDEDASLLYEAFIGLEE